MNSKPSRRLIAVFGSIMLAGTAITGGTASAAEPFVGQIQYFPYNFAPRNWSYCNGQLLPISQNTALFSLLGTTFGGDGRTSFGLPDMRGRTPVHPGSGAGLPTYQWGQRGGTETVTLTLQQLPSHNHTLRATNALGNSTNPSGNTLARDGRDETYENVSPNVDMHANAIASSGGGQPHENMPPYLALNCNIALTGIYPSRN
jgi:microcystin-dependent protein